MLWSCEVSVYHEQQHNEPLSQLLSAYTGLTIPPSENDSIVPCVQDLCSYCIGLPLMTTLTRLGTAVGLKRLPFSYRTGSWLSEQVIGYPLTAKPPL